MKTITDWKFYYPYQGETADDARHPERNDWWWIVDAQSVAEHAVEHDFNNRAGATRGMDTEFIVAVIDKHGNETRWIGWNEATVAHQAREFRPCQPE